jgi:lysophospholipase L1-like esterase
MTWPSLLRLLAKAAVLFFLCNAIFALSAPLETLGSLSLYNWLLSGRERLPYGEKPAESYNLSLNSLPAMMASHVISRQKPADEFRVVVIGDSGTWGWLLENEETLAGRLNQAEYTMPDGRRLVAYNLGYPIMSLTKDLLLMEAAMGLQPDLILWPVTLQSFPRDKQLVAPIVQHNPEPIRRLIQEYALALDPADPNFVEPELAGRTIVGQRRALADLLRLQLYGFSWAATAVDQAIPEEITLRQSDFDEDLSWNSLDRPQALTEEELALDVLAAGVKLAGDVPLLIINESIFISDGQNSDIRYNAWYPRWAYDAYRELLGDAAAANGWPYLDLWDSIAPEEFTDSPVHLTPAGIRQLASLIAESIREPAGGE